MGGLLALTVAGHLLALALSAVAGTPLVGFCGIELVAIDAVRSSTLPSAVSQATHSQSLVESAALGGQNFCQRQAQLGARLDGVGLEAALHSQVRQTMALTFDGEPDRNAPVELVLAASGPPAIPRLVISIVVDAVDYIPLWPWPHVGSPSIVTVPPLADRDATPTVIGPLDVVRIVAPLPHTVPDMVEWLGGFERHLSPPVVGSEVYHITI